MLTVAGDQQVGVLVLAEHRDDVVEPLDALQAAGEEEERTLVRRRTRVTLAGAPLLSYQRYNVDLTVAAVQSLDPAQTDTRKIESLSAMDSPANMTTLFDLGVRAAQRDVRASDFPLAFDLPPV